MGGKEKMAKEKKTSKRKRTIMNRKMKHLNTL
jgi:hypothetical protein